MLPHIYSGLKYIYKKKKVSWKKPVKNTKLDTHSSHCCFTALYIHVLKKKNVIALIKQTLCLHTHTHTPTLILSPFIHPFFIHSYPFLTDQSLQQFILLSIRERHANTTSMPALIVQLVLSISL